MNLLREELELDALPRRKLTSDDLFLVSDSANYFIMCLGDIVSLQVSGNYTQLTDRAGRRHLLRKTLTDCAQRLPAEDFFQPRRDIIVNLAHIKKVDIQDRRRLLFQLDNGEEVILSTHQTIAFRRNHSF